MTVILRLWIPVYAGMMGTDRGNGGSYAQQLLTQRIRARLFYPSC